MHAATIDDLTRTRSAFDTWRASRAGRRRRIPEHLWQMALALLPQYSGTRVCRELGLSYHQLRQRLTDSTTSVETEPQPPAHFLQVRAADLTTGDKTISSANGERRQQATATNLHMIYERSDGSRLTLSLPSSDWDHIAALCQSFMHG